MTVKKTSESGSDSYPAWICFDCGEKYGRRPVGVATWHEGTCGVCRSPGVLVTEPRDFGHLLGLPAQETVAIWRTESANNRALDRAAA